MRRLLMILIAPLFLFAQDEESWQVLEREVRYAPRTQSQIDSIFNEFEMSIVEDAFTIENRLPTRSRNIYSIGWGPFNAGYAYIEDWRDDEHFYVSGKAVTNSFISSLRGGRYRVRDWVYTVGDVNGLYPHFFEQHIEEGDYRKERWTIYDQSDSTLMKLSGDNLEGDTIEPYAQNYMSILYNLRNSELIPGDTLHFPTYVHGEMWDINVVVHETETVTVPAGEFECIKVQPILVGDGEGFNENDEMFIWLTNDDRRVFVKGRSRARIGHLNIKLLEYEVEI